MRESRERRLLAIAGAGCLFAAILAIRLAVGDPAAPLSPTYALPVVIIAVAGGRLIGILGALVATAIYVVEGATMGTPVEMAPGLSRLVTYVLLGALLGHYAQRSRAAQRHLVEADESYRDLLERVPAIVYTAEYGSHGRWSYVSPKIEQILGYTVEEWLDKPDIWYEHLHPDDRHQALAAEERSSLTGEPLDSEYRMLTKDGRTIWFRDGAAVVNDEQGRPAMLQGVMLDITSRKRAEDELELRYAVQGRLAEAASLNEGLRGVLGTVAARFGWKVAAFWTVDEREEKLMLTDMWCAADVDGKPFEDASRSLRLARDEGLPGRAWSLGEAVWAADVQCESYFQRRPAAEAIGLHAAVACPAMGGNQVRGVLEFFACEPRAADEEALSLLPAVGVLVADFFSTRVAIEEHRERFQAVLDNAPAMVFAKDIGGRYLFVNRRFEQVLGPVSGGIAGRTNHELFPEDVARGLAKHDQDVLEAGQQIEFEEVVPHEDGVRSYLTVKFPLRDAVGAISAVCGISTDVTELKHAQFELDARAELERAHRAKSAFLSRVSHELRTPLNAILGFGQVLEIESLSDRQRNSVDQIMHGGRHLLGLVNDILEISRIESGEMSVSLGPVDVGRAVSDIVSLLEPLAGERSVRISHHSDPATPDAFADEQRVKQVLLNLVSNAIKYNREAGSVEIVVTANDRGGIAVRITDTGPGIAAEHLERLFSPFDRLDAEQSAVEGTGLGLAVSKLMTEAMHGSLEVSSVPGTGSTFTIVMPTVPGQLPETGGTYSGQSQALARAGR